MLTRKQVANLITQQLIEYPCVAFLGGRSALGQSISVAEWLSRRICPETAIVGFNSAIEIIFAAQYSSHSTQFYSSKMLDDRALYKRTSGMIELCAAKQGAIVAFPATGCGSEKPKNAYIRDFQQCSNTWSAIAYAIELSLPCYIWLPQNAVIPSWELVSVGFGWHLHGIDIKTLQ